MRDKRAKNSRLRKNIGAPFNGRIVQGARHIRVDHTAICAGAAHYRYSNREDHLARLKNAVANARKLLSFGVESHKKLEVKNIDELTAAIANPCADVSPRCRHRLKRPRKRVTRPPARLRLYARWIGTYGSPEFGAVVGAVLEATNELAAQIGDAERAAMRRHFRTTSRYEWMFWDMGYRLEQWPFEDAPDAPRTPGR